MRDKLFILIPGVFTLVGAILVYVGLRSKQLARASQQWPSTAGKVTRSEVEVSENRDSEGQESRMYTARVEYDYAVGGRSYKGTRVQFGLGGSNNGRSIQQIVDRYPIGAAVDVYYDPEKPDRCVLDRTASAGTFLVVLGTAFLVISILVGGLIWAIR